jgi:hypothetical protein
VLGDEKQLSSQLSKFGHPIFHHTCTRLQNAGKGIPIFQKALMEVESLKPSIYVDYSRISD